MLHKGFTICISDKIQVYHLIKFLECNPSRAMKKKLHFHN